jgi:cytochrome c-type biogenesis protein CcmE
MVLKNGGERTLIIFIWLLLVSQIFIGSIASVAANHTEHTYVVFQDDFEDGEAENWTIDIPDEAPLGSNCLVEEADSNYVLSSIGQTWAEVGDSTWTNYTIEVKFKFITSQGCAMINFRLGDPPSCRYFLQLWVGDFFLTKQYLEAYSEVKYARLAINTNTWYNLKIVCVGNNIRVYVDNVLKIEYVDNENPFLSGRIGLETCADSQIHYDDVKVSTTHCLYITHLIKEAQDEIYTARSIDANTSEAEQRLAEAQDAFANDNLSSAESLANEALNLVKHASVGPVSVNELSKYSAEYDKHVVEVSGTIRDIRYEEGAYSFAVDDGTGVISVAFNGTLGEIKTDDKVKVVGVFDASTTTVIAESLEKVKAPMEGLYTFLIFKDDFEDGDFSGWVTSVAPEVEASMWKVEKEGDNYVLSGEGDCWSSTGDQEWTDYILELKIKLIRGCGEISFRMIQKTEAPERYIIKIFRYELCLVKGEPYLKEERHTDLKCVSVDLDPDEWYTVKTVCQGNNIKIYLNDNLKIDYTDNDEPFLSGMIVLATTPYDEGKLSHLYFDDVKVSQITATSDINDLILYAQSEIDEAKEINADVNAAELKLEQAKQALAQEDYQIVQYLVDEAVWLAKRASVDQITITNLKVMATKISGHSVTITGTVKNLEARYGVGYDFTLDDGTDGISVTYQGVLADIGNEYEVEVTGVFDAPSETVAASRIEKISVPLTSEPTVSTGPLGVTLSLEQITLLISIGGTAVGVIGWMARTRSTNRRKKILFKKLIEEVDDVYSRFKMNSRRCEGELHRLKDEVLDEFKEGMIDEDNYNVLDRRIDDYLKEVKEQIEKEKL